MVAATVFEVDPATVERELGSLAFSRVVTDNPMLMVRAAHWHNLLDGLGLGLPFFLVHDIGLLLTQVVGQGIVLRSRDKSLREAVEVGAEGERPPFDRRSSGKSPEKVVNTSPVDGSCLLPARIPA